MIQELLTYIAVFTTGIFGAGIVFVLLDFKTSPAEKDDREIPYENFYLLGNTKQDIIKYEKLENVDKGIVEDETPEGKVIIKYNEDNKCFDYWSNKSIKYKYLEVLARKYVIIFECKENYINMFKELLKSIDDNKKNQEREKKRNNDVFAKLKNYDDKKDKEWIVNQKANIYKKIGSYDEYFTVKKQYKQIDYKSFRPSFLDPSSKLKIQ
tara:strand:- start:7356 stop:7985 length:630 start_codon:yes stop_codon:yes gene_type:complete